MRTNTLARLMLDSCTTLVAGCQPPLSPLFLTNSLVMLIALEHLQHGNERQLNMALNAGRHLQTV